MQCNSNCKHHHEVLSVTASIFQGTTLRFINFPTKIIKMKLYCVENLLQQLFWIKSE